MGDFISWESYKYRKEYHNQFYDKNSILTSRKYKCRICGVEIKYGYGYCLDCNQSNKEKIEEYEKKLESKRKYYKGNKISSVEQFEKQKLIYWHNKIYSIEWLKSLQYRTVLDMINRQYFFEAVKK